LRKFIIKTLYYFVLVLLVSGYLLQNVSAQTPNMSRISSQPETPLHSVNSAPTLTARAAIAIDADTGRILYAKNPHQSLPMASTTKIMTVLTLFAIPGTDLNEYTVVTKDDLVGEANMGLVEGQRIRVLFLLYGALMDSANDAATAIAHYAGSKLSGSGDSMAKFVQEMNRQATLMGMEDSKFANPHGLDNPSHYTSAQDLAIAGWYAMKNTVIANVVKLSETTVEGNYFFNISNFIRRYPGANGVKPGETDEAGLCLVASASRFGHNAIVVELNNPNLRTESDLLMDYAFNQILDYEKPGVNRQSLLGYIGLPDAGKLRPYRALVTDFQRNFSEAARYLLALQGLFAKIA
jgi:D-alanyl-D-alanine carboxypeptidase (penicillin-binding protein 5/6)